MRSRAGKSIQILLVGLLFVSCRPQDAVETVEPPAGPDASLVPDQIVEDGEHLITNQGVKKALLKAEQLYFYNEAGKVLGDTVEVRFFDDTGAFVSTLTAEQGEMVQATQAMIARGNVFVRGRDSTIRTEELFYDPENDRIYNDVDTEIVQRGNVIHGNGVESDTSLKQIRIRGSSAVLRSEPELREPASGSTPADRDST